MEAGMVRNMAPKNNTKIVWQIVLFGAWAAANEALFLSYTFLGLRGRGVACEKGGE